VLGIENRKEQQRPRSTEQQCSCPAAEQARGACSTGLVPWARASRRKACLQGAAGQSRPGSAQRRSAWGPAAWRQQRREEEGGRLGGALLWAEQIGAEGRAHGGTRAGGRQRTRRGIRGEGDAYIGTVERFWLARQEKKMGRAAGLG